MAKRLLSIEDEGRLRAQLEPMWHSGLSARKIYEELSKDPIFEKLTVERVYNFIWRWNLPKHKDNTPRKTPTTHSPSISRIELNQAWLAFDGNWTQFCSTLM